MLSEAHIPAYFREVDKIATSTQSPREKVLALAGLMEKVFFEATREYQIAFSTLFSRIDHAKQRYGIPQADFKRIHRFRIQANEVRRGGSATEMMVETGVEALRITFTALTRPISADQSDDEENEEETQSPLPASRDIPFCPLILIRDVPERRFFAARREDSPESVIRVRYDVPEINENFKTTVDIIRKVFGFPVPVNLVNVRIDPDGYYVPKAIIVAPDYLIDVSAVSECFRDTGAEPFSYLAGKFLPHETTEPIFLGNIANFFLDRLLNEPNVLWQSLFLETFQLYPFLYAPMTDSQVKSVSGKAQKHFVNIKSMAIDGFKQQGIDPADCMLEPAFYSARYGIQGRLDLWYNQPGQSAIVELKSGTPFKPNAYGLTRSHYTQTLLYDLLVRSVFGKKVDPLKYILYSGVDVNQLRYAPTIVSEQWEALQVRNQLVAIERMLTRIQPGDVSVSAFQRLRPEKAQGFTGRDFARFEKAYSGLSLLEKKYFNAFTGFIAREQWLARNGDENIEILHGHASLWRSSLEDKILNFSILSHLEIMENKADQLQQSVLFRKTPRTNKLANFRVGDIAVLYPAASESDTVLQHQVIKCSITRLEKETVEVQLRYRQHNLKPFDTRGYWCLEPDMLDSGFVSMYRSLFEWAESGEAVRKKILGATAPPKAAANHWNLVDKMLSSPDFFLLWGPPGTGKTSVVLRDVARKVLETTRENLLILAYTNRAVDEICESLDSIGGDIRDHYLRLGSRHACGARFLPQLLSQKIAGAGDRKALRSVLDSHRIFVSTVASFSQNEGLLKLKKFQRLVVDEASQILEPQLAGLLTRFQHFILIGDHRQLPAVTAQRIDHSAVSDDDLNGIGIYDLRDSYFERLYLLCQENEWTWAFDRLDTQGRMHRDIMEFPGKWFYDGKLKIFNPSVQDEALQYRLPEPDPDLGHLLAQKRMLFLHVQTADAQMHLQKTSAAEARTCARIVSYFRELWAVNGKTWVPEKTLGIISPWRAQIAQIREALENAGIDPDSVTVDTVERYQGGARDIILISTCVHSEWQLSALLNVSREGVDRKLNVALTRAREHLVMIGNERILGLDDRYRAFIEAYKAG